MWNRLIWEDWQMIAPGVAFVLFLTVFILIVWRALRQDQATRERLARMPLDEGEKSPR